MMMSSKMRSTPKCCAICCPAWRLTSRALNNGETLVLVPLLGRSELVQHPIPTDERVSQFQGFGTLRWSDNRSSVGPGTYAPPHGS